MGYRYQESGGVPATLREGEGVYVLLEGVPPCFFGLNRVPEDRRVLTKTAATKDALILRDKNLSDRQTDRINRYMKEGRPVDEELFGFLGRENPRRSESGVSIR